MRRALSRVFNCVISGVLCCALVPAIAFADNNDSSNAESVEQSLIISENQNDANINVDGANVTEIDSDLVFSDSQNPQIEESSQIALYANSSDLGISVNYDRANIRCGVPIKFTVNASGGRGKYKYRMDSWELQGEGYWPSVLDPSSWTNKHQDSNVFELTFFASGTYKIRFSAMESNACGDGPYLTSRVPDGDVWITINDPNYPTKEKVADRVAGECNRKNFSTDYEKALWLHDWLLNHCEYDIRYCNPEGALVRGEGNCEAYHGAFMMLLERVGIPCGRITGNGHVWTAAKLDGDWCQIDVTWDDYPQLTGYPDLEHLYFGLDDKLMGFAHSDHTGAVAGYESNSLKNHYYIKSGEIKKYSDQYVSKIQDKLNNGTTTFSLPIVETYWADSYNNIIQSLVAYDLSNKIWRSPTVKYKLNVSYANHVFSFQGYGLDPMKYLDPGWNQDSDGNWRYGNKEGNAVTGWLNLSGTWYYLDPATGIMTTGWLTLGNYTYYFSAGGDMYTGLRNIDGHTYAFDSGGAMKTGWYYINGANRYFLDDGKMATGKVTIGGKDHYFNAQGVSSTGWVKDNGQWLYIDPDGSPRKGWLALGSYWYYLDPTSGTMTTGWLTLGNYTYYFSGGGDMYTGVCVIDGKTYVFEPGGSMIKGWYYNSGNHNWYWMDIDDGHMLSSAFIDEDGQKYYLNYDGKMQVGWKLLDGGWIYAANSGRLHTGWLILGDYTYFASYDTCFIKTGEFSVGQKNYYANENGDVIKDSFLTSLGQLYYAAYDGELTPINGFQDSDNNIYLYDSSHSVLLGWQTVASQRVYADPNKRGILVKGWILVDGKWYWGNENFVIATGWKYVKGKWYWLDPEKEGAMDTGWKLISGKWYYFNNDGSMQTGWLQLNGNWYYLKSDGSMVTGSYYVDGKWREFDSSGRWIDPSEILTWNSQWLTSATPWLLVVDTSNCYMGVFYGYQGNWQLQHFWYCAPGKPSTPTVKGHFTVGNKGYYFDSYGVRCFYWTQFYGNYLFHSVLYAQTSSPQYISDGRTGMQLSHGCVRLDLGNAYWIYANIPRGTKVFVF